MRSSPIARHLRGSALLLLIHRFPVAILAAALCAASANLEILENPAGEGDAILRSLVAFLGAAAIATATILYCERRSVGLVARHLSSLALAACVGAALFYWDRISVAFPALFAAAFIAIPLAPYAGRSSAGFWTFGWLLLYAGAFAVAAVVMAGIGLAAIVASIGYLFGFEIDSSIYGHVWVTGFTFVAPVLALSLVPTGFPDRDDPASSGILLAALKSLSDCLVVPLLAAYALLLHVYAVKVAVDAEVPRGQIGWMVLTFGLAVLAVRVAVHPMAGTARAPTRLFLRWWPAGLIVPLVLLVFALWERVSAYGVTPERYALGLFAGFLALLLAAHVFGRARGDVRLVPALAAAALLVSSFGPWGMFSLSARSQTERLKDLLSEAGALRDGLLSGRPDFTRASALDVRSIVDVLTEIGETDRLRAVLPDDLRRSLPEDAASFQRQVRQALNVDQIPPEHEGPFDYRGGTGPVEVAGYDIVVPGLKLQATGPTVLSLGGTLPNLRLHLSDPLLEIETGGAVFQVTAEMIRPALEARPGMISADAAPLFVDLALGGKRLALLVDRASGKLTDNRLVVTSMEFQLYLRRADWVAGSRGDAGGLAEP